MLELIPESQGGVAQFEGFKGSVWRGIIQQDVCPAPTQRTSDVHLRLPVVIKLLMSRGEKERHKLTVSKKFQIKDPLNERCM